MSIRNQTTATTPITTSRTTTIITWSLQILAAAAFVSAGAFKLAGAQQMVDLFTQIGLGQSFRILTGIIEVLAGLLLLWPVTAGFAAIVLAGTMVGAVLTHVFVIGGSPVPAIVLLAISLTIAWLRRARLLALIGR